MKVGDLVVYRRQLNYPVAINKKVYVVRRVEKGNGWLFVYGLPVPIESRLMKVISEAANV